jgi:hypothetical protein
MFSTGEFIFTLKTHLASGLPHEWRDGLRSRLEILLRFCLSLVRFWRSGGGKRRGDNDFSGRKSESDERRRKGNGTNEIAGVASLNWQECGKEPSSRLASWRSWNAFQRTLRNRTAA